MYTDIESHLKTDLGSQLKHVALWNSQITHESVEKPFNFPAVFVEFSAMDYTSEAFGIQKCETEITIHCVFSQLVETITFLDFVQLVVNSLNEFSGTYFTGLKRIKEIQDVNHDRVMDWQILFKTTITDDATSPVQKMTLTTPTMLEMNLVVDIDNDVIRTGDGVI